jgi:putative oxidoreductase
MNHTPPRTTLDAALLILRIASALAFLYHGSSILFGAFDGPGPQRFATTHHMPEVVGYLVGLAQLFGGLTVLTGIFVRIGAVCVVTIMLGAIFNRSTLICLYLFVVDGSRNTN